MKRISVIGVGRLGLSFALLAESAGYEVMGADKRSDYVKQLNKKEFKTPEPQIEDLLLESKHFLATTDIEAAFDFSDFIFVFVPTPSKEDGEYDHRHIDEVLNDLIERFEQNWVAEKTLIIGCTTMPGYCKSIQERLTQLSVNVVYSPSFIAQGSICHNLKNADFVLMGCDNYNATPLMDLYVRMMDIHPNFRLMTHTAAEITKIAVNCFLTTKISYANMIAEVAINSGEEESVKDILTAIGHDSRIGHKFLNYGFGFGGVCLPRDGRALGIHAEKVGVNSDIQNAVDEFNGFHLQFLKVKFMKENPDKNFPFIFNQLSYKKGTDILTESQHYQLCKELLGEGYKVNIVESEAVINAVKKELEIYGDRVTYGTGNGTVSKFPERMIEAQKKIGYVIEL